MRLLLVFLLSLSALAQTPVKPQAPAARPAPERRLNPAPARDEGSISGDLYTSDYFRFRYRLPAGFTVEDDLMQGRLDASGRSFVLLAATGTSSGAGSPTLVIMADSAAADPGTYIANVTQPLLQRQGFTPQGAVASLTIAGHRFARADFTKQDAAQTVLVTMRRGYALNFILMGPARVEVDKLSGSLEQLRFLPPAVSTPPRSLATPREAAPEPRP